MRPAYRADIDGLRAIAVLAVVGFHAFPEWVPGGYTGVDVFFVISGYLISTIIAAGLAQGRFSFTAFYIRRIRRIFPALLLMLATSLAAGWFVLLADEYRQLGKHAAGGAGFIANFLLWGESGYFDTAVDKKPMLHLWSLSIEEQFYLAWPPMLWLAWKKRIDPLRIMVVLVLLSFALNAAVTPFERAVAFYWPQTRFWELLAGAVLAHLHLRGHAGGQAGTRQHIAAALGAALILAGVLLLTRDSAFPGWWALLPVCGTLLLISAGAGAGINRALLGSRVLVWIGLISYPLYLWHWLLLSFATLLEGRTPSWEIRAGAIAVAAVLAWLTYVLLEKPVRTGGHGRAKAVALLALMLVTGGGGYACYVMDGFAARAGTQFRVVNEGDSGHRVFHSYLATHFYPCTPAPLHAQALRWEETVRCFQSQEGDARRIAIIGDSHGEHLFIGIAEALPGANVVFYIKNATPDIDNPAFGNIFRTVIGDAGIRTVLLSASWNYRMWQAGGSNALEQKMDKTVDALLRAGKRVYFTDDVPAFAFDPNACKYRRIFSGTIRCAGGRDDFERAHRAYLPFIEAISRRYPGVVVVRMDDYFCDATTCSMAREGVLFYRDENHLNINGSRYAGRRIVAEHPGIAD